MNGSKIEYMKNARRRKEEVMIHTFTRIDSWDDNFTMKACIIITPRNNARTIVIQRFLIGNAGMAYKGVEYRSDREPLAAHH